MTILSGIFAHVSALGPPSLLAAQLAAALPLGLAIAGRIGRRGTLGPIVVGLAVLAATVAAGPAIAGGLDSLGADFLARAAVRSLMALVLATPWLMLPRAGHTGPLGLVAAATVAFVAPLAFAYRLGETRTTEAASSLESGRLVRAREAVDVLVAIGWWRPVGGQEPVAARRSIDSQLARIGREVAQALPADAGPKARIERAFHRIQVGRDDEAASALEAIGDDPDALLLLASLDRDRGRLDASENAYRRAIVASDADRLAITYDGLIETLSLADRPDEAAAIAREAARRLPRRAGAFVLQLGRLELQAGRPASALASLGEATRLDPALAASAAPLIRRARVATPACLVRPFASPVPVPSPRRSLP